MLKSFIDGCKHDGVIGVGGSQSGRRKHVSKQATATPYHIQPPSIIGIDLGSQQ